MTRLLALLLAGLCVSPHASAFELHLDHGFPTHHPGLSLGGNQVPPSTVSVFDVSGATGVVVAIAMAAQERHIVRLRNPGPTAIALRLDLLAPGGSTALPGTKPIDLRLESGEEREFAMHAWQRMDVVITAL